MRFFYSVRRHHLIPVVSRFALSVSPLRIYKQPELHSLCILVRLLSIVKTLYTRNSTYNAWPVRLKLEELSFNISMRHDSYLPSYVRLLIDYDNEMSRLILEQHLVGMGRLFEVAIHYSTDCLLVIMLSTRISYECSRIHLRFGSQRSTLHVSTEGMLTYLIDVL